MNAWLRNSSSRKRILACFSKSWSSFFLSGFSAIEIVALFLLEQILPISSPGNGCTPGRRARFRTRSPFHPGC